jgi:hypothetical protein
MIWARTRIDGIEIEMGSDRASAADFLLGTGSGPSTACGWAAHLGGMGGGDQRRVCPPITAMLIPPAITATMTPFSSFGMAAGPANVRCSLAPLARLRARPATAGKHQHAGHRACARQAEPDGRHGAVGGCRGGAIASLRCLGWHGIDPECCGA